jgi:hypothetical protein
MLTHSCWRQFAVSLQTPATAFPPIKSGDEMATDEYATLVTLHDLGKTIADTRDDIRGRKVADTDDHEIGKIDALLIDDKARKIRFLQVETGASWALAKRKHRSRSTRSRRSGKTKSASTLRKMT